MECTKVQYTSERFAMMDIDRIKKKSNRDKVPVRAYFCDICDFWHLTSTKDKNTELKDNRILSLEAEIKTLKLKINELEKSNNKEDRALVKADERVVELTKGLVKHKELIRKIRYESNDLISKNIQLQNKIDKYEAGKSNDNGS
jgi:hypothetical protein